ncbi:type II secretion system protein GspC [Colwellia echini]|uniref:Type II secretion system protein GspC n=2 Tax=Colwellia echini TaxID=1982103 RepID=A0ABY3N1T7_9GAMM|nr:type II secretion system protein GspC [Colwellia echini]
MTDLSALLSQLGHKRVAQTVTVLLLIYISFVAAKITWSVVPQNQGNQNASQIANGTNSSANNTKKLIDVAKIQSLNLFGLYNESDAETIDIAAAEVPETKLNLVLSGLVASDNNDTAAAIIEYQGKQETYGVGDIIVGTRASLEQVLMDRVLIKQSGALETLMLDGFDYNQPALGIKSKSAAQKSKVVDSPKASTVDQRNNEQLTESAKDVRSEIAKDPANIGDYLRISPKRKDGNIIGYSLRPGKKPEFFELAGLKPGDVAVQMNGYDLTATTQAMQAMVEMKEASNITLLVDRDGGLTEILISL